ncbi:four helix bundle protein [Tautonia rosea]|uniref:four helix bundle protein n=1 Tax=Tautonia rosea TaxID=2728037 RepID=UPI00147427D7|nr:four helix bundle protein [Tautonia rosea]
MASQNYRDLIAWQRAMDLVEQVYQDTARFPNEERFGLTNQLRRSAVAIPSNIAEGQGRGGNREFHRFLSIAHGSLREVETQLLIADRLRYLDDPATSELLSRCSEVGRLLNGLMNSLARSFDVPTP